jgi:deoxycytidylate deaminase
LSSSSWRLVVDYFWRDTACMVTSADPFLQPDSELVLGLVAPVGADLDLVQSALEDRMSHFRYEPKVVRLSRLISALDLKTELQETPAVARYNSYMSAGNEARKAAKRGDFLALSAIYQIQQQRQTNNRGFVPLGRRAHILRSLKHPDEVRTLRRVYGSGFFLIGVHAPPELRLRYLIDDKNIPEAEAKKLLERDEDEGDDLGQRTRDTFELCDAFVSLQAGDCKEQLWRILDLLFGRPDITPTRDEYGMFLAYSASMRSRDLSRQVGAVVLSKEGETIATGANDVPRFQGGLYWSGEQPDHRDWERRFDSNERERNRIAARLVRDLLRISDERSDAEIVAEHREILERSGLMDITEFGRAVHAEMEALLSCSRSGATPRGGTLYSTTFPCHNCAKHIVAAGIERVVYVEPYPKSRAPDLHDDSVTLKGASGKVRFEPFVGIGARRFIDLFSMRLSSGAKIDRKMKKKDGEIVAWDRASAELRVPMAALSYIEREQIATKVLNDTAEGKG